MHGAQRDLRSLHEHKRLQQMLEDQDNPKVLINVCNELVAHKGTKQVERGSEGDMRV